MSADWLMSSRLSVLWMATSNVGRYADGGSETGVVAQSCRVKKNLEWAVLDVLGGVGYLGSKTARRDARVSQRKGNKTMTVHGNAAQLAEGRRQSQCRKQTRSRGG